MSRRTLLGAALAGTGGLVATSLGGGSAVAAALPGPKSALPGTNGAPPISLPGANNPLHPLLPVLPSQPKGSLITLLGTAGGPQAEYVRTGTSTVLTVEGYNYVIDAGRSSVTQYLNSGLSFRKLAGMFITHLHADHLADYYNYFLLETGQPNAEGDMMPTRALPVYGPGRAGALPPLPPPTPSRPSIPTIAPANPTPGIKDLTDRLTEGYAYSWNVFLRGDGYQPITLFTADVNDIAVPASAKASPTNTAPVGMRPFTVFEDCRVRVSAVLVPHGSVFPCFAYRFDLADGRAVVFSGDTSKSDNVIALAHGADVLVHEVMNWDFLSAAAVLQHKDPDTDPLLSHLHRSHTTTEEVAQVAQAAGVPQLVLTHLIPSNPIDVPDLVWKAKCSVGYRGDVHVGNDRDRVAIPTRRRVSSLRRTTKP